MNDYVLQPLKRLLRERAFVICSLVLAIGAVGLQVSADWLGVHFIKLPLELQKPLDQLDESVLAPYRVVRKQDIENQDVIDELGTESYIQWFLEDTQLDRGDPARLLLLFITYYTGDPGQVPHVPEVCYTGSGNVVEDRSDSVIRVKHNDGREADVPVRVLSIAKPGAIGGGGSKVIYFFSANGEYVCSRNALRIRLNNWHDRYAYFSKVEVSLPNGGKLSMEQAVSVMERIAQKLVPVLVSEHWPLWPPTEEVTTTDRK